MDGDIIVNNLNLYFLCHKIMNVNRKKLGSKTRQNENYYTSAKKFPFESCRHLIFPIKYYKL